MQSSLGIIFVQANGKNTLSLYLSFMYILTQTFKTFQLPLFFYFKEKKKHQNNP